MIKKSVRDSPKLYVLKENNSAGVFGSLQSAFLLIVDKISADNFK